MRSLIRDHIHIITSINNGGAENNITDLLCEMGIDKSHNNPLNITVLYLKGNGYWKKKLENNNVTAIKNRNFFYSIIFLIRQLKKGKSVIFCHLSEAEIYGWLAFKIFNCISFVKNKKNNTYIKNKFFIVKHNAEPFITFKARLPLKFSNYISAYLSHSCDKVICISDSVKQYWQKYINSKKLVTIYYGLSKERIDYFNNFNNLNSIQNDDEFRFLFVGRLVPQKNIFNLLNSFRIALSILEKSQKKINISLTIIGEGYLKKKIINFIEINNLEKKIFIKGYKKDIRPFLSNTDCLIHVAKYEGLGMILLEAMASRKAIISSNTSAMKEIVQDKKTGLLCDHENIIDIADKIVNMAASNKNILFAEKGYERLKNKFHIKRQLKETLKLINK